MTVAQPDASFKAALRGISVFEGLTEEQLDWFAANAEDLRFDAGETVLRGGAPADELVVILEGELRTRRMGTQETPMIVASAGEVSGMLPFSRMTTYKFGVDAELPTRLARLDKRHFDEMLRRIPQLLPRLVALLADRVREVSRATQQREKLMALGKLSAGLAHELNNPASAARRAAESLRQTARDLRAITVRLDGTELSAEQRRWLASFEERALERVANVAPLDSLEQSDREDELNTWMEGRNVHDACRFSPALVESGIDVAALKELATRFEPAILKDVLGRVAGVTAVERLLHEIEGTTARISDLVRAIKEYTYMDQLPEQEVDLHKGIESTLTMLKFRLKKGVNVSLDFDRSLPLIFAHGSELNQVWTNLIENAVDAMEGKGELRIRTARERNCALVEIIDNGPGIAEELQPRIFDPFFTTKGVGEGTGLGLDTVYRIVQKHHGDISVESKPGETRFQVRIPFSRPQGTRT